MRALLLVVALILAGVLGLELNALSEEDEPVRAVPAKTPQPPPSPVASAVPRAAWVATILARPLFAPGRRPPTQAADAAEPAPTAQSLPRLAGVLLNGTDRQVILVPAGGPAVVARVGTQVGGVTVQSIEAGQATVLTPDGLRVLRVSFDTRPPGITQGIAPAAPPLNLPPQLPDGSIAADRPGFGFAR